MQKYVTNLIVFFNEFNNSFIFKFIKNKFSNFLITSKSTSRKKKFDANFETLFTKIKQDFILKNIHFTISDFSKC